MQNIHSNIIGNISKRKPIRSVQDFFWATVKTYRYAYKKGISEQDTTFNEGKENIVNMIKFSWTYVQTKFLTLQLQRWQPSSGCCFPFAISLLEKVKEEITKTIRRVGGKQHQVWQSAGDRWLSVQIERLCRQMGRQTWGWDWWTGLWVAMRQRERTDRRRILRFDPWFLQDTLGGSLSREVGWVTPQCTLRVPAWHCKN